MHTMPRIPRTGQQSVMPGGAYASPIENAHPDLLLALGVHPDDLERCVATYVAAFDAQGEFEMQYRMRRADGEYRWILERGAPMRGTGGEMTGYVRSCIDVSDRTRSALEQQRAIHDYALQTLFGIGLISQAALAELTRDGE